MSVEHKVTEFILNPTWQKILATYSFPYRETSQMVLQLIIKA